MQTLLFAQMKLPPKEAEKRHAPSLSPPGEVSAEPTERDNAQPKAFPGGGQTKTTTTKKGDVLSGEFML